MMKILFLINNKDGLAYLRLVFTSLLRFSRLLMPYLSMTFGKFSIISGQAYGLVKLAVPTPIADAPARYISRAASAESTPPIPMMGRSVVEQLGG